MTVLAAAQDAAILLLGRKPSSLFGSDQFGAELGALANEAAADIVEYYDWQKLRKLATFTGDGATASFDLPIDYNRMLKKGAIHSTMWRTRNFRQARDEDEFLLLKDINLAGTPGVWLMLGGQLQFFPPPSASEVGRYYYISNRFVSVGDGQPGSKAKFTADNDAFVLPERLITLALMWRWRALKRLEYSEDMQSYGVALDQAVAKDRGSKVLTVGTQRHAVDAVAPYPGTLG